MPLKHIAYVEKDERDVMFVALKTMNNTDGWWGHGQPVVACKSTLAP
jgi:hypothetical protein